MDASSDSGQIMLDAEFFGAYNPSYSGVVSVDNLIEKEMQGGSLRREVTLKSPDVFAEENQYSVTSGE